MDAQAHANRFFAALDKQVAAAMATPAGKRMSSGGWLAQHTGGGCMCWEKVLPSGHYLWICDEGNGLGGRLIEPYLVGLYSPDGDRFVNSDAENLDQALAWCAERMADPAGYIERGDQSIP